MGSFELKEYFPLSPKVLYQAWLNSEMHTAMTGGAEAICCPEVNGSFSAWNQYISGFNLILEPYTKIVQAWRTTDFAPSHANSELTLSFTSNENGCLLILNHNRIPQDQPDYEKGWIEFYFNPMKAFFKQY